MRMLTRKLKAVGILLLVGYVCTLCKSDSAEAAPTPAQIVRSLDTKLDKILKQALKKEKNILRTMRRKIRKYNNGKLTGGELHQNFDNLKIKAEKRRRKFNRNLNTAAQNKLQKLSRALGGNVGSNPLVAEALVIFKEATDTKEIYFNDVVDKLDAQLASPWN